MTVEYRFDIDGGVTGVILSAERESDEVVIEILRWEDKGKWGMPKTFRINVKRAEELRDALFGTIEYARRIK
jgi:hypothetical protein